MVELPTYFYISMFTVLLLVWAQATVAFSFKGDDLALSRIKSFLSVAAVAINVILYVCLLIFIIIYAARGEPKAKHYPSSCKIASISSFAKGSYHAKQGIVEITGIVFHLIVAVLVVVLALCFFSVLVLLYRQLGLIEMIKGGAWGPLLERMATFSTVVMLVCLALLGQASVLVAVSFVNIQTIVALFLLLLFEWLPAFVLMLAMLELFRKPVAWIASSLASRVISSTGSGEKRSGDRNKYTSDEF